ncbi:unnamed protein product [Dicrocoelium dendriticum]|nr:unnamed protein product [Dicrocoelium dendriticum]
MDRVFAPSESPSADVQKLQQKECTSSLASLPAKAPKSDFNVWSFLKQCIGKDLTRISMPVALNEPISFLQRVAEYMEYSELLLEASSQPDPVRRMESVCAFAVSATSSNFNRIGKPFNPLLGETYELHQNDFLFIAEQVSHHPPVTAFHVESEHFRMWSTVQFKLVFWGKSIEVHSKGPIILELYRHNEVYTWQYPSLIVHNLLMGKMWVEHVGPMEVTNRTTGAKCHLEFHPSGWSDSATNQVTGHLSLPNSSAKQSATRQFFGNWTRGLFSVDPPVWEKRGSAMRSSSQGGQEVTSITGQSVEPSTNGKSSNSEFGFEIPLPNQRCLWTARPRPLDSSDYYNFTLYAMRLNELSDQLASSQADPTTSINRVTDVSRSFLPPTDSRFRPDIRALERANLDLAETEKHRLEEKQRHSSKAMMASSGRQGSHSFPLLSLIALSDSDRSSSSGGNRLNDSSRHRRVSGSGPLWFQQQENKVTKQTDWCFTGEYWSRDWSRCPDLY